MPNPRRLQAPQGRERSAPEGGEDSSRDTRPLLRPSRCCGFLGARCALSTRGRNRPGRDEAMSATKTEHYPDLVCEEHMALYWPHDDCAGPGIGEWAQLRYELTAQEDESTLGALLRERRGWFAYQDENIRLKAVNEALLEFCRAVLDRYNTDDRMGGLGDWLLQ